MTMGKGVVGRALRALVVCAVVSCLHYPFTWARDPDPVPSSQREQIGEIKRIQGTVSIGRAGEGGAQPAQENAPVFLHDTLSTDQAGKAWWRSDTQGAALQQADASLGKSSALEFVRLDQEAASSVFSGEVGQGMVRFIKDLPRSVPPSHFIISTPTAVIEVLSTGRPADFVVEVSEDQKLTTVYGIWGAVKVTHISAQFVQQRIVRSCQRVDVQENREPHPVIGVSPQTLKELIGKTTIPHTLPEDVPWCREEAIAEPQVIEEEPAHLVGCPCPPGQEWVGGVCAECSQWKRYDRRTCSCVSRCRHDKQCRRCETCWNGLCVPKKCPPGQRLDERTCTCIGECPPIDCPHGFWFNPRTCRCERKPCDKKCPPGQWLDTKTCECTPRPSECHRKCPPGQRLDLETCRCVPTCHLKCRSGEWLNLEKCQCEPRCRKQCSPGQRLDLESCKCISDGAVPTTGCRSDGDCGPGSVCRNHRCVQKEGHVDKPSRPKHEQPTIPAQPSRPKHEQPTIPAQPSKPKHEQPTIPAQPSKPKHEQPTIPAQPQQRKDQKQ